MAEGIDAQQFGMTEATAASGYSAELLRVQSWRGSLQCGTKQPPPLNRWTYSVPDVLFLRVLRGLTGTVPGFDLVKAEPSARTLAAFACDVWKGTEPADLCVAIGSENVAGGEVEVVRLAEHSAEWVRGVGRFSRALIVVPVGAWVAEVRENLADLSQSRVRHRAPPNPFASKRAPARED